MTESFIKNVGKNFSDFRLGIEILPSIQKKGEAVRVMVASFPGPKRRRRRKGLVSAVRACT